MRKLLVSAKNVHVIRDFCRRTLQEEASHELAADLQHDLDIVLLVAYHTKAMPELLRACAEYVPERGKVEAPQARPQAYLAGFALLRANTRRTRPAASLAWGSPAALSCTTLSK